MRSRLLAGLLVVATVASATPLFAHHSFAMFDREKQVTLQGEVLELQWTNPHIWIELGVVESGKTVTYSLEGASPNALARRGWKRTTLKPGMKVSVVMNPLKSGGHGGAFVRATLPDGTTVSNSAN